MSISDLPKEILHDIFQRLTGCQVIRCRAVCTSWRDAVDSLSDTQWHKICTNESYFSRGFEAAHEKHGLSWFDTFKAQYSWFGVRTDDLQTTKLCDNVIAFKVLPHGIVSCLLNRNDKNITKFCDTVVYYDTNTCEECDRQEYDFEFYSSKYDENAHLQVFVLKNKKLRIIVKESKKKYCVGMLNISVGQCEMTLIGKTVYFKNSEDKIIYKSEVTKQNTLRTRCLKAFEKNHENFNAETIIGFTEKDGEPVLLSDEGSTWRANVYHHKNADFSWTGNPEYEDGHLFGSLEESGLNWKTNWVFRWLCEICNMEPDAFGFYANDPVIITLFPPYSAINIHESPLYIPAMDLLKSMLEDVKPLRKIPVNKNLLKGPNSKKIKIQLDVIETPTNHKVLAKLGDSLYIYDFKNTDKEKTDSEPESNEVKITPKVSKVKKTVVAKKKGIKKARLNK